MNDQSSSPSASRGRAWWLAAAVMLVVLGAAVGWWWQRSQSPAAGSSDPGTALAAAGMDGSDRAAIEAVVRDYILEHPEILPEAMQRLEQRGAAQQIASLRGEIERPFPGAVLGNPNGKLTLVEFSDFSCTYCRKSVEDIEALTKAHPDLRVVVRELPILSPASAEAARMALAAARQGRYAQFQQAMFSGPRPDQQSIAAAAKTAGLDLAAARQAAASPAVEAEVRNNLDLASRLGVQGTPAWVIGDQLLVGAVGRERLDQAIAAARRQG